jgi:cytochrome c-type biogenesis protein CcsB
MRFVKELLQGLVSIEFMLFLTVIFAFSIGFATFIENDFGSETAWALVYGARWFEILWILLAVNLIGNIIRYRMWKPKKLPAFIFHISFLVIFLGAALTRYTGYEGMMHIREGSSSNEIISSDSFLYIKAVSGDTEVEKEKKILLSILAKDLVNNFEENLEINGKKLTVRYIDYYPLAEKKILPAENGKPLISVVFMTDNKPVSKIIRYGDTIRIGDTVFSFGKPVREKNYVYVYLKNGKFYIKSDREVEYFEMKTQKTGKIPPEKEASLEAGRMYSTDRTSFVVRDVVPSGKVEIVPEKSSDLKVSGNKSALIVEVEYDGEKKIVKLLGGGMRANIVGEPVDLKIKDLDLKLKWGAKLIKLPFEIYLKDFIVERYPGSMQPSSYESEVIVKDPVNNREFVYRIYMNHTLEYGGYKFFQSSYDPDEKGTVLSVNHDPGKIPTYIGYTLLALGLFLNLLNPYSRFGRLARLKVEKLITGFLLLLFTGNLFFASAEENPRNMPLEKVIQEVKKINKDHAEKFGRLITQSFDGRLEPVDTLSIEVMNKISKRRSFFGLDHNQIVLGMLVLPRYWQMIPVIKVSHPAVKKILGIPMEDKYLPFYKAFDEEGNYKLYEAVELARRKKPARRNQFDKEVLKIDERLNIMYMVFTGELFRIFPLKGDPNHTWYSPKSAVEKFPEEEAKKVKLMLVGYFASVEKGIKDGDWSLADKVLEKIKEYQKVNGADVYPSETKIKMEILYNKLNIFERLIFVYLFAGLALLGLIFAKLIKPSLNLKVPTVVVVSILVFGFLLHTFNLGLRWYIAGHAPWSNGYESMIYIAWTIILAGIVFARQSPFAVASTGILAGITLFVAHLSWMDPQITNIVPVLKSYWLTIHVSVITASYGFLGLSALLGLISLLLFIIRNPEKQDEKQRQIEISILEATRINEMSMILGLSLLTVGNFLGGVWANESWGRYWGWDPKETWALVTILVYTAVIHTRLVPYLRSTYLFAVLSVVSFFSVLMTYFGVNFYLSGLHSYASGDPVPIPVWVYWAVGIIMVLIVLAFRNRKIRTI